MNLSTATPVEIDTELACLDAAYGAIESRLAHAINSLHHAAGDRKRWIGRHEEWQLTTEEAIEATRVRAAATPVTYLNDKATEALARFDDLCAAIATNLRESGVLEEEYNRRPWTRAFLAITNGQGHVHSSKYCSTCNNGTYRTMFGWQPQYSGADEVAIIKDAGYRACTVCYPNAPVGDEKSLPTKMFTADEILAANARDLRAAAKAERDAKKIEKALTPDGSELVVTDTHGGREHFKTERAATTWAVQQIGYARYFDSKFAKEGVDIVLDAIAAKHDITVEEATAQIEAKVVAWRKRNS
jgi:hypothetical protein